MDFILQTFSYAYSWMKTLCFDSNFSKGLEIPQYCTKLSISSTQSVYFDYKPEISDAPSKPIYLIPIGLFAA